MARENLKVSVAMHPLERTLVILASAQLVFMPWALGGLHLWSQLTALVLSLAVFTTALIPRRYDEDTSHAGNFRMVMWPRLVRFPIFWLGLAGLVFIAIQALNPAVRCNMFENGGFTLSEIPHVTWLPAGLEAPFEKMNAWRRLILYAGAWFLACGLWVGITRRKAVLAILSMVAINGALFSLIAILQRVTGTREILWFLKGYNGGMFFGTIAYKNAAGAFLNLTLTCAVALTAWHYIKSMRRLSRNSPLPIFSLCGFVICIAVVISNSRGAAVLLLSFILISALIFARQAIKGEHLKKNLGGIVFLIGLFGATAAAGWSLLRLDHSMDRLDTLLAGLKDPSLENRSVQTLATLEMGLDRPYTGWGSGSYRWVLPRYQDTYPKIAGTDPFRGGRARIFWNHAHNDYAQAFAEVGVIGLGLIIAMLATGFFNIARYGGLSNPPFLIMVAGLSIALIHCYGETLSTSAAILSTFVTVLILAGRWAEVENTLRVKSATKSS
jgi:O-antigen ligase